MSCRGCANKNTSYCSLCKDEDFFRTKEQKEYEDWMCDMLCPQPEEDLDDARLD